MSQTTLVGRTSSCASAIARTSAVVISPRFGSDCAKASSALPNSRCRLAPRARSGRSGLRTRIRTLSGSNSSADQVGQLGLRDPLVGRAQVLADVGPEVVDPPVEQPLRQPRRREVVAGEEAHLLGRPDPVDDRLQRPARQAGQERVLPALLHPRERQLHAADVRHDLELVLAQAVAEVARDPVEERVAAADQHRPVLLQRLAHLPQGRGHLGVERRPSAPATPSISLERRRRPQDQVRLGHDPPRRLGQAGQPVVADPHDHQLRSCLGQGRSLPSSWGPRHAPACNAPDPPRQGNPSVGPFPAPYNSCPLRGRRYWAWPTPPGSGLRQQAGEPGLCPFLEVIRGPGDD